MRKPLPIFGWKAILRNYGWTSFWLDSILPLIVSLGLCTLMYVKECRYSFTVKASCRSGYFYRSRNGCSNIDGIYYYADFYYWR